MPASAASSSAARSAVWLSTITGIVRLRAHQLLGELQAVDARRLDLAVDEHDVVAVRRAARASACSGVVTCSISAPA